jgi:hypothetical protein
MTKNTFLLLGIALVIIGALVAYYGYSLCRDPSSCAYRASVTIYSSAQGNISDALLNLGFAIIATPIILYLLFKEEIK